MIHRARVLLDQVKRLESKALLAAWIDVLWSRQLAAYRNALKDKYGDLLILQPGIFYGMPCINTFNCSENDYDTQWKMYVRNSHSNLRRSPSQKW